MVVGVKIEGRVYGDNQMREAELHLPDEGLEECGLQKFISVCREAQLQNVIELHGEGDGYLWSIRVGSPLDEERLAELNVIKWWERLSTPGESVTYLCKIRNPGSEDSPRPVRELGVSKEEMTIDTDGIKISLIGTQSDISQSITEHEEAGMNLVLQRITDYTGPDDPLNSMTNRQQEVLLTAFGLGYFAVPREATTEEVASALDLDPSTVREHLQRAQQNLFGDLLGSE